MVTSGSDSSRCRSAGVAAENCSPWAGADGSDCSAARAEVVTSSLPVYGCGTAFAKPHARTR